MRCHVIPVEDKQLISQQCVVLTRRYVYVLLFSLSMMRVTNMIAIVVVLVEIKWKDKRNDTEKSYFKCM